MTQLPFALRPAPLAVLLLALSLGACSRLEGFPKPQLVAEPDGVTARLAAAADRAATALDQLAAIENTRTPTDIPPLVSDAPVELRRAITVDWIGSAEPLVKQLADRASYRFKMSGQPPAVPMVVTVRVRNAPLIEVMRDVGLQLDNRATLKIDPSIQTVELVYGAITPPPLDATAPGQTPPPVRRTDSGDPALDAALASPLAGPTVTLMDPGPALPAAPVATETLDNTLPASAPLDALDASGDDIITNSPAPPASEAGSPIVPAESATDAKSPF